MIKSDDFDLFIEAYNIRELEYDGTLDLVKATIKRMGVKFGLELITRFVFEEWVKHFGIVRGYSVGSFE